MQEELWFTELLNKTLGGVVTPLLNALPEPFHPAHPAAPFDNVVSMQVLVFLLLMAFFVLMRSILARSRAVDNPGGIQQVVEILHGFVDNQSHEIIGHEHKSYVPYLMTMGLWILLCNLIGLIPTLESPTASPVVPLGCAVSTFLYYNFHGIRHHGWHYIKQFLGPSPAIAPLMLPIELVSHLARIMSLTVRLFANIFAGDMVTLAFFSLIPILVPVLFLGLHLMVAIVQTFIFVTLTMVYLGMALSEEH